MPSEKLLSFRVVPTYDKVEAELASPANPTQITPGLLLLTEKQLETSDRRIKQLKIVRCPIVAVSDWSLEIGTTPDPRKATEVLPGAVDVTVRIHCSCCFCESIII